MKKYFRRITIFILALYVLFHVLSLINIVELNEYVQFENKYKFNLIQDLFYGTLVLSLIIIPVINFIGSLIGLFTNLFKGKRLYIFIPLLITSFFMIYDIAIALVNKASYYEFKYVYIILLILSEVLLLIHTLLHKKSIS